MVHFLLGTLAPIPSQGLNNQIIITLPVLSVLKRCPHSVRAVPAGLTGCWSAVLRALWAVPGVAVPWPSQSVWSLLPGLMPALQVLSSAFKAPPARSRAGDWLARVISGTDESRTFQRLLLWEHSAWLREYFAGGAPNWAWSENPETGKLIF